MNVQHGMIAMIVAIAATVVTAQVVVIVLSAKTVAHVVNIDRAQPNQACKPTVSLSVMNMVLNQAISLAPSPTKRTSSLNLSAVLISTTIIRFWICRTIYHLTCWIISSLSVLLVSPCVSVLKKQAAVQHLHAPRALNRVLKPALNVRHVSPMQHQAAACIKWWIVLSAPQLNLTAKIVPQSQRKTKLAKQRSACQCKLTASKSVKPIPSHQPTSSLDLPVGMPPELLTQLKGVWVAGKQIKMSPVGEPTSGGVAHDFPAGQKKSGGDRRVLEKASGKPGMRSDSRSDSKPAGKFSNGRPSKFDKDSGTTRRKPSK